MVICMGKKRRRNNLPARSLKLPSKESHKFLKVLVATPFLDFCFFMLKTEHFTIIHKLFHPWSLQGECGVDVDQKPACSGAELMSFVFRLKSLEELNYSPPMGMGSADIKRRNCKGNSKLLLINQARQ